MHITSFEISKKLAEKFKVSIPAIESIRYGKAYKNIDEYEVVR